MKNIQVSVYLDLSMAFKETLKQLRKEKGYSQQYLADLFGYKSFTTIQKWEDGSAMPPSKVLGQLANLLNVSVESLLNERSSVAVPILGTVKGGPSLFAQQEWLGQEWVSSSEAQHGDYFYLEVVGDSMVGARIYPSDLVYVKKTSAVESGDIVVALINEETTVKRLILKGETLILHPENPAYSDSVFTQEDVQMKTLQILGKVEHIKIRL